MDPQNRRDKPRAPLSLRVDYPDHNDYLSDWTANVSARGFFVVTDKPFSVGDVLQTHLQMPDANETLAVKARVVWRRVAGQDWPAGVGVKVVADEDQNALLALAYRALGHAHGGRFHVVAVDDDPAILQIYDQAVKGLGEKRGAIDISVAASGEQALKVIAERGVDLAILDLKMPGIDGYELTRRLRAAPETRDIPILAITAQDWKAAAVEAHAAGVDEILQKPFRFGEFLELVALMLAARMGHRAA